MLFFTTNTSARTRFLKYDYNSVLAFEPLAELAQLLDSEAPKTAFHPSAALKHVEQRLGTHDRAILS